MSDPYYDIDIPHLEDSLTAANKRRRERPRGGVDDPDRIGWFFFHLADYCREEGDKARLRRAIGICFDLLDGHSCPRVHCDQWSSRRARNCRAGKNPKTCPICKKYLAKKAEREAAKADA